MAFLVALVLARQSNRAVAVPVWVISAFRVLCFCLLDPLGAGCADRVAHQLVAVKNYSFPTPSGVAFARDGRLSQPLAKK